MTAPAIISTIAKEMRQWRELLRVFLSTAGGTQAQLPVTNGATTVTYTFPVTDVDTAYGVTATPNWATTVYVSARSTTALTLTFGTAAGANATVDLMTFRS